MSVELRSAEAGDRAAVVALNQSAVPAVTPMTEDGFDYYVQVAERFVIGRSDTGEVTAMLILMSPGADTYSSANYRWFSERYDDFCYVDRIAIAESHRGEGLGRQLYELAIEQAASRPLLAEVNLRPRNAVSLAFHESMGFEAVGTQEVEDGAKEVVMLCRPPKSGR